MHSELFSNIVSMGEKFFLGDFVGSDWFKGAALMEMIYLLFYCMQTR